MLVFDITKELIFKFLRFGVVGVMGTAIDFGLTFVSKEVFKTSKYLANAFGFTIAATTNYFFNKYWTFQSTTNSMSNLALEYGKFFIVALIGLGLNTLIIYILTKKRDTNFYIAKVFATGVVLFWNFGANLLFTFAKGH